MPLFPKYLINCRILEFLAFFSFFFAKTTRIPSPPSPLFGLRANEEGNPSQSNSARSLWEDMRPNVWATGMPCLVSIFFVRSLLSRILSTLFVDEGLIYKRLRAFMPRTLDMLSRDYILKPYIFRESKPRPLPQDKIAEYDYADDKGWV